MLVEPLKNPDKIIITLRDLGFFNGKFHFRKRNFSVLLSFFARKRKKKT